MPNYDPSAWGFDKDDRVLSDEEVPKPASEEPKDNGQTEKVTGDEAVDV